jgi:hypothetical protein
MNVLPVQLLRITPRRMAEAIADIMMRYGA